MARILVVGAHVDDIEFAMGATLSRFLRHGHDVHVLACSDAMDQEPNKGFDLRDEFAKSMAVYGVTNATLGHFQTNYFYRDYQEIRDAIYKEKIGFEPEAVFCTSPKSAHPDHQYVGNACLSIFQECSVICMEDVRGGQMQLINKWIKVTPEDIEKKITSLKCYKSQEKRIYMNHEKIKSMSSYRGLQIAEQYAEAFEILKEIT